MVSTSKAKGIYILEKRREEKKRKKNEKMRKRMSERIIEIKPCKYAQREKKTEGKRSL
jgi:DNA-binding transcriptional regulator YhcF (GntR family)